MYFFPSRFCQFDCGVISQEMHAGIHSYLPVKSHLSFQTLLQEIVHQQPVIEQVQRTGHKILEKMQPGPERDVLKFKLADMSKRFPVVANKATDRKEQLDKISPLVDQYQDAMQVFEPFLDSAEEKLEKLSSMPQEGESAADRRAAVQVSCLPRPIVLAGASFGGKAGYHLGQDTNMSKKKALNFFLEIMIKNPKFLQNLL